MLSASYAAGVLAASVPGGLAASRFGREAAALVGVALTAVASARVRLRRQRLDARRRTAAPGCRQRVLLGGRAGLARRRRLRRGAARRADRHRRWARRSSARCSARCSARSRPWPACAPTFVGVSLLGVALAAWVARHAGSARAAAAAHASSRRADRRLLGGLWLLVLPALLFGVLAVLVPLRLHARRLGRRGDRRRLPGDRRARGGAEPAARAFSDKRGAATCCRCASRCSARRWSRLPLPGPTRPGRDRGARRVAGLTYGGFYTPGDDAPDRRGGAGGTSRRRSCSAR